VSIKKNLVYNFILSVSQVFLPLISIPYISRVLDPAGIGEVSFIDSFTFYFISIAEFGIVVYGMREVARLRNEPAKKAKLISELLALHIISSSITLILYCIAVLVIWNKVHDIRLLYFSLSYLVVNFFACEWYFLGMEKFRYITIRSLLARLLGLISIFILIKEPSDYYIYYAIIASSAMINSIWNNYLLFKEVPVSFRNIDWKRHIRKLRITYFISLIYGVTLILDNVLLRIVSTASAVGYYAFSIKIVRISTTLLSDSLLVFFPRIVSFLKENKPEQVQLMITRNLQLLILFSVPICAGIFLLAEPLVIIFLGQQFIPATDNLKILACFPFLKSYNLFLSKQILISHNHEKLYLNTLIVSSSIFVFLMLFFSSMYADTGASFAIIITEFLVLIMNYNYVRNTARHLLVFDVRTFIHAILGAALFIPIVYLIRMIIPSPLFVMILSIGSCFMVYMIFQSFVMRNDFMTILKDIAIRRGEKTWTSFINDK
jgi:O-antigen/teichoic acid export membrane protein